MEWSKLKVNRKNNFEKYKTQANILLLQIVTKIYYTARQVLQSVTEICYKVRQMLQNVTSITKCDKKKLQSASDVIQSMTIITKWGSTSMLRISGSFHGSLFNSSISF